MVKVSICIPTYTRIDYLKELVECCLTQTYIDFEICISQDVAPNGLVTEIKEYCETLALNNPKLIKYKAQKANLGLAGNWNVLLDMAEGEFIFIPGDDDLISTNFLEKMLVNTNSDVIFCNQKFIDDKSNVLNEFTKEQNTLYKRDLLNNGFINEPIVAVLQSSVPMSAALIRRKWFSKFCFDNLINTPELEVFLKIAISGGRFLFVNEQLASFRIHPSSATGSGLTTGRYIANIIDIAVPDKYNEFKANLVSKSIIPAINDSIKRGEKIIALKLYRSKYYPKNAALLKFIHFVLLTLPNTLSAFILNFKNNKISNL